MVGFLLAHTELPFPKTVCARRLESRKQACVLASDQARGGWVMVNISEICLGRSTDLRIKQHGVVPVCGYGLDIGLRL